MSASWIPAGGSAGIAGTVSARGGRPASRPRDACSRLRASQRHLADSGAGGFPCSSARRASLKRRVWRRVERLLGADVVAVADPVAAAPVVAVAEGLVAAPGAVAVVAGAVVAGTVSVAVSAAAVVA